MKWLGSAESWGRNAGEWFIMGLIAAVAGPISATTAFLCAVFSIVLAVVLLALDGKNNG